MKPNGPPPVTPFTKIFDIGAAATTGTGVVTGNVNSTGATFLVASVSWFAGTSPTAPIADNKSNTWNHLTTRSIGNWRTRISWCIPTSVGVGHSFSASGFNTGPTVIVSGWTQNHASPADQENGAGNASASNLATGSITPTANNSLIIAGLGYNQNVSATIGSGFTLIGSFTNASGWTHGAMAYLIQSSATAINPTWTATGPNNMVAAIASFKHS